MFNNSYSSSTYSFWFLNESGIKVSYSDWESLQSEFLSQLAILYELIDNGNAEIIESICEIEHIDILKLSEIDKKILGLPEIYPYEIFIESDGILTHQNFKFKKGFYDFCPNGNRLTAERNGAIITLFEKEYLLSENQYLVCEMIDVFNSLPETEKGSIINLKKLAEIKSLSKKSGLSLEYFLDNQELHIPGKVRLDIDYVNGSLGIIPKVDSENDDNFTKTFDRLPVIRDIYPISNGNNQTTRILISENQKKELQKVKQLRNISDENTIQEIIEHPELFFNEEEIDYTVFFSDRVIEIGVYSPKFFPFSSPYKSHWIPGIVVKNKVNGEKRIYFKTFEKLSEFIEQKDKAIEGNRDHIQWENIEIPITDAENFIEIAKKQFENPKEPVKPEKQSNNEVLIIKENAELTEFVKSNEIPEYLKHNFYEITNLNSEINLKEHQKEGISWLQTLFAKNFSGGLLADDMGLGKTLQILYFIEWHYQNHTDEKPYLIVAPVSLLENWELEYSKFFNPQNIPILKLYGSISLTKENNPLQNYNDAKRLQRKQIVLTNYETVRVYQFSLALIDFSIIVLDEAQKIKTPGTLITNASKALKADFKVAMTGTPVENNLVDIWCLMDFAVPGLLGNAKDFAKEYQTPLKDINTDVKELTERLRANIGVFIKRRLKKDVAKDLPNKFDNENSRIKKVMPPGQFNRYMQELDIARNTNLEGINKRNQILKSIWALRDISDHPFLIDCQISNLSTEELISNSAKLQIIIQILNDIKLKNQKVIIFADRKETQKMLQKVVFDTFKIFASIVNGDTPALTKTIGKSKMSRQQTIDRFQVEAGFNVIVMSPLAAGVGLNVTEANHIIHYTRHWNPAKEEQATDRAYRIGQQKDVYIYYPMSVFPDDTEDDSSEKPKSFDEILDNLLNNKKALASNTLFPTEQAEITPDELMGSLFKPKMETNVTFISLKDIDILQPNLFEAAIAALYRKQDFEIYLTPFYNNKGVNIIAMKSTENFLIQVKQTNLNVAYEDIRELFSSKTFYENKFKTQFNLLLVTNSNFSDSLLSLESSKKVKLINRSQLDGMLTSNNLLIPDINSIETQRLSAI